MTRRFQLIDLGYDTTGALAEIDAQPELWNVHSARLGDTSPHRETSDIWCRYREPGEATDWQTPFRSVWYPSWKCLPSLHAIYHNITVAIGPTECGGVLITKIPSGGWVYPHHDRGTWHSEHHNRKVWMPLRANDRCVNYSVDDCVTMKPGEAWSYSNLEMHAVHNGGDQERICLIMCYRCEP